MGHDGAPGPLHRRQCTRARVLEPIISTILFPVIGNCHLQKSSWDNVQKLSSRCPDTTHTEDNLSAGGRGEGGWGWESWILWRSCEVFVLAECSCSFVILSLTQRFVSKYQHLWLTVVGKRSHSAHSDEYMYSIKQGRQSVGGGRSQSPCILTPPP